MTDRGNSQSERQIDDTQRNEEHMGHTGQELDTESVIDVSEILFSMII